MFVYFVFIFLQCIGYGGGEPAVISLFLRTLSSFRDLSRLVGLFDT